LIEDKLQSTSKNPAQEIEDINLLISDKVMIFDNLEKTLEIVFYSNPNIENSYEETFSEIDKLIERLGSQNDNKNKKASYKNKVTFKSNMNFKQYSKCIEKIKDYIIEGDVMQVVFAQERSADFDLPPFELYKSLRKLNPSPYMFFLDFGDYQLVGSSPEILVRLEHGDITVRPIAGTKPRGQNEKEDQDLEDELRNDPKELAEHLMLIDLGRNDIGRVSEIGSVNTNEKMIIEKYSHVMHLVSNVVGKVRENISPIDALKATFPAGTLSGAPKVRAMEIIDELEVSRRRIYGGAVGYISWSGNMDTAIVIRSAVIKDNKIYVGAGGGIVADSVAEKEWEEVNNKSMAIVKAINNIGS
jgi:anthranilate synthase component 1